MHTENKRRLGEALTLILYFILDAYAIWPESHLKALFAAVFGTAVVLLIELPWRWWAASTTALAIIAMIVYFVIGPVIVPDVEVTGLLQAGGEPTPPNGCDRTPYGIPALPPDTLKVLFGNNAVAHTGQGKFTALQIAQCPVLAMERTASGIGVFADLYDAKGKLIARVTNNQIHVLTGEHVSLDRRGDLSTLIVTDGAGAELLHVRYLNETAIKVRGVFGCPGHTLVRTPEMFINNSCLANNMVGISVD